MWSVVMEPVPPDPRRRGSAYNGGGVAVYVTTGAAKSLVGRVAYCRRHSAHPLTSFGRRLRKVIARAEAECERLNG